MELREFENFSDFVLLPVQYNGLIVNRSRKFEGERRLLWTVLEDAIKTYLVNARRATPKERRAFEEVRRWFRARGARGLFSFHSICDLLGIDSEWLLRGLQSSTVGDLPSRRRQAVVRTAELRRTAA